MLSDYLKQGLFVDMKYRKDEFSILPSKTNLLAQLRDVKLHCIVNDFMQQMVMSRIIRSFLHKYMKSLKMILFPL